MFNFIWRLSDAGWVANVWAIIWVLGATKVGRDEPSNQQLQRLVGFFDVYKQLMYSPIIFPLLLKYMTKAKYLIRVDLVH